MTQIDASAASSPLRDLLHPRSVAIVGASADPRSFGGFVLGNLGRFGFEGRVHLVSRSSAEINGRPCVATIAQLPRGVDLAVLAIPEAGVHDTLQQLAAQGCGAAVLFASGYAESGEAGKTKQQALLAAIGNSGMKLVGPNCMGFTNFAAKLPMTFEPVAPYANVASATAPGIAVVAQSGALAAGLRDAFMGRGLPLSCVFSTGNEVAIGVEEVLSHFLQDEATRVIAVYAEQIRQPQLFLKLADEARSAGKPVVLLMPGKSARARAAAQSHTGALAGDHAVASSMLLHAAVVLVDSLDELIDTTTILLRHPQFPEGGVAFMTGSGAVKNLALDFADTIGLPLPELGAATVAQLAEKLPSFAVVENPLDYTTIGIRQPGLIGDIVHLMVSDPAIASLVLAIPAGPEVAQRDKVEHIVPALAAAPKPVVLVISGDDGPIEPFFVDAIRTSGVPFFRSADRALRALRHACAYALNLQCALRVAASAPIATALPSAPPSGVYAEYQGKTWLKALGIAVPAGSLARVADEAAAIAASVGYPVVLKAQASALPHKSEAGGVMVGINDEASLRRAWAGLHDNVAGYDASLVLDGVLVEAMGAKGLELVIGGKRDPDWGVVLLVGLGGIWIEALNDVRLIPAGMVVQDIRYELTQLKAAAVLSGVRGAPAVDLGAIAQVVAILGQQMLANPGLIEVDINPLIAYPLGSPQPVLALDALLVAQEGVAA
jgi:acetate---CoA ligase (ADP-forming)